MSYRDMEDDDPAEVEHLAEVLDAPDPAGADAEQHREAPLAADRGGHQAGTGMATGRLHRRIALGVAAAVLAAGGWYVYSQQAGSPHPGAAPTVTATPAPPKAPPEPNTRTPAASAPTPSPGGEPAPPAAPDGAAATRALTAVRAFLPAWTMQATPDERRAALTHVTTTRLVEALADVAPEDLPAITGEALVDSVAPAAVLVAVPTSAGTAQLTVEPIAGRWLVTTVSLAPPPATTPAAPA